MRKDIAGPDSASTTPTWDTLEGMVREKAPEFIQHILEDEVTELLGRKKSERRAVVDAPAGYRKAGLERDKAALLVVVGAQGRNEGGVGAEVRLPRVGGVVVGGVPRPDRL